MGGGSTYARVAPLPRSPLLAAAMQMLCAGVGLAVVGIAMGELGRVHPSAVSGASLAAVVFLIVFGSLIAFTAYGWLLKNASTPLLSTYAYVNPGVALLLGWAFAGERVGGRELAAGLVILSSRPRARRTPRAGSRAAGGGGDRVPASEGRAGARRLESSPRGCALP